VGAAKGKKLKEGEKKSAKAHDILKKKEVRFSGMCSDVLGMAAVG
jgi:hypothetical protein